MLFRLFILLTFLFSHLTYANLETKQAPEIEFKRLTYESLKLHPCKVYLPYLSNFENHPVNILQLKQFPAEKGMILFIKRPLLNEEIIKVYEFCLEKTPQESIFLSTGGFLPGERVEILIKSKDEEFDFKTSFIPNPIRVKDKDGTIILTAELTIASPYDVFTIHLPTMPENEKLLMKSISGGEIIKNNMVYSKNAMICFSPNVEKKHGGICKLSFTDSKLNTIRVNLPWGSELDKYTKSKKIFDTTD